LSPVGPLPLRSDDEAMGEDDDAAVGASGEEPAHPTTSTLATMSNNKGDFIQHLSFLGVAKFLTHL
jgi:hypothetical protein